MEKIKKHFQENIAIYLVLITCVIVFGIIYTVNRKPKEIEVEPIDTSLFITETLQSTLQLFKDSKPIFLVMGVDNCSATHQYVDYLRYEYAKVGLEIHYLDLNTIKEKDEKFYEFVDKLDFEYTLLGETNTFGYFIGTTPMTVIIKDKKQVYGHIGSMDGDAIEAIAKLYGLI